MFLGVGVSLRLVASLLNRKYLCPVWVPSRCFCSHIYRFRSQIPAPVDRSSLLSDLYVSVVRTWMGFLPGPVYHSLQCIKHCNHVYHGLCGLPCGRQICNTQFHNLHQKIISPHRVFEVATLLLAKCKLCYVYLTRHRGVRNLLTQALFVYATWNTYDLNELLASN